MISFASRSILAWLVTVDCGSYPAMYVNLALTELTDMASSTIAAIEAMLGALRLRILPDVRLTLKELWKCRGQTDVRLMLNEL